jgi:NAD(P)-dependent dehydrogenase (short-subunit alcohol dehydrogenase family)
MVQATWSMHGKICLVTGATSGLGLVTAQALAQYGATVVIVGRHAERGAAAVARIKQATGNAAVALLVADLSVQAEIHRLVQEFQDRFPRLDVLVNNAGAFFSKRQVTADGIEMTFALNHLGYFLLTNLLLETLQASAPARIVNVSSDAHRSAQMYFADPPRRALLIVAGAPIASPNSPISCSLTPSCHAWKAQG